MVQEEGKREVADQPAVESSEEKLLRLSSTYIAECNSDLYVYAGDLNYTG